MLANKVFVTGIYGSGKSTFVRNHKPLLPNHVYLSFDKIYGYADRGSRMDLVYNALNATDRCIMDALPLSSMQEDWAACEEFISVNNCCIVLVECDIDHWYSHNLKHKACYTDATESQHKQWFSEFYTGLGADLATSFGEKLWTYDSCTGVLSPPSP